MYVCSYWRYMPPAICGDLSRSSQSSFGAAMWCQSKFLLLVIFTFYFQWLCVCVCGEWVCVCVRHVCVTGCLTCGRRTAPSLPACLPACLPASCYARVEYSTPSLRRTVNSEAACCFNLAPPSPLPPPPAAATPIDKYAIDSLQHVAHTITQQGTNNASNNNNNSYSINNRHYTHTHTAHTHTRRVSISVCLAL